jgi:hypothetical protein
MGNQSSGALSKQELKELETQTKCMSRITSKKRILKT